MAVIALVKNAAGIKSICDNINHVRADPLDNVVREFTKAEITLNKVVVGIVNSGTNLVKMRQP